MFGCPKLLDTLGEAAKFIANLDAGNITPVITVSRMLNTSAVYNLTQYKVAV